MSKSFGAASGNFNESSSRHNQGGRYFDATAVPVPDEVFGIPTRPAIKLAGDLALLNSALFDVSLLPGVQAHLGWGWSVGLGDKLQAGLELLPLIERVLDGEELTPRDVRPYRGSIKRADISLAMWDGCLTHILSTVVPPIGILGRMVINKRLEKDFPQKAPDLIEKARAELTKIEPEIDFIARFPNPRGQFIHEVRVVLGGINEAIGRANQQGDQRDYNGRRNVASGILEILAKMLPPSERVRSALPLLSRFALSKVVVRELPSPTVVSFVVADILEALESVLPEEERWPERIDYVRHQPSFAIPAARMVPLMGVGRILDRVEGLAPRILPNVRDLLPTRGAEMRARYDRVQAFLAPSQER